jgi:hypothetical protein
MKDDEIDNPRRSLFQRDCRSGDAPIDLPTKAKLKEIGMQEITSHLWFLGAH